MTRSHLVMLDSGAYTAWSKGKEVDLSAYIQFCHEHPNVSYYVNLDVIPGSKGRTPTHSEIDAACKRGWQNYKVMAKELPPNKILPVFHRNESQKWLDKYLNAGVTYIGISPGTKANMADRLGWMKSIKPLVLRKDGTPTVKMHGFGVSSSRLLFYWRWHTVDSTLWIMEARVGNILVPRLFNGKFDYKNPSDVQVSHNSPRALAVASQSPIVRKYIESYLAAVGVPLGRDAIREVKSSYMLKDGETWVRKHKTVRTVVEDGVCNNEPMRRRANVYFLKQQAAIAPVDSIYLAGGLSTPEVEEKIDHRLVTYADMRNKKEYESFMFHVNRLKGSK